MSVLDWLATWWLTRRRMLVNLKPNPMRIEVPHPLSQADAARLRAEWTAKAHRTSDPLR